MEILVTGGSGKAGRSVVEALRADGHAVTSVDLVRGDPAMGKTLESDLTQPGEAYEALAGMDACVHLAAIPAWWIRSETETFRNNVLSTYNVFAAAATLRVPRVIWASSETVYGFPFERAAPAYVPLDEASELRPETSYALSKVLLEEAARYFAIHSTTAFLGMRLSNILGPEDYPAFRSYWSDPRARSINLWSYVDIRDVVEAIRLALVAPLDGAHVVSIHAADTVMTRPSLELVRAVFPETEVRGPLEGTASLVSVTAAQALLGWVPRHTWRDTIEADEA